MSIYFINIILATLSTGEWIAIAAIIISILGSLLVLIFKSGSLFTKIDFISSSIQEIKSDVKIIPVIDEKVNILWKDRFTISSSPIVLNERGIKVLEESKIETLTDKYYAEILKQIRDKNPQNAYQAQEILIEVVQNFKNIEDCKNKLEDAAFITGVDVDSILMVAAINIRDKIINDLQFKISDIDKFDPKKTNLG